MNIEVTRNNVTILEQSETPHENEYKITTCYFTFDEFTSSFQVKRAIFTVLSTGEMYETDIVNDKCDIPVEVLKHEYETVKLGVYSFDIETVENDGKEEEVLKQRTSPSYDTFVVPTGSYEEGALSPEPITPSQYDLYSQALQEGLQEVDDKLDEVVETVDGKLEEVDDKLEVVDGKIQDMDDALDDVDTAITETNNLNLDVSDKIDGDVTVTLTKKDATTKSVVISDGTSLQFMWQGTSLGIKTDDMQEYVFVDLQGIQGVPGPQGEPFRIKKTYPSVADMNADFDNMEYGDYVMIASTVEVEDNAKLYTRGESQWIFITDFSGATGIKGETGATPNIQIGTVTSGSTPSVTRTGTNENPVLNFVLQPGPQGQTGQTGPTGNGIASITKTSTSGLVDTYTITYTSGNTTTFNVTNGNGIDHISLTSQSGATKVYTIYYTDGNTTTFTVQDGEVTQEVFDEEVDRLKMVYNAMPKVSDEDTEFTLDNTAECPVYDVELSPSELEQESTTGANLFPYDLSDFPKKSSDEELTATVNNDGTIQITGTKTSTSWTNVAISRLYNPVFEQGQTYTIASGINLGMYTEQNVWVGNKGGTFTPTENWVAKNSYWTTNKEQTFDVKVFPMAIKGSTTIDENNWEPFTYGASPNPQFPQQIHTVSGENSVKVGNKNLFNLNWVEYRTNNGITATLENDHILLKGTATASAYINFTLPNNIFSGSYSWYVKSDVNLQYGIKVLRSSGGNVDISPSTQWSTSRFNCDNATGGYIYIANGTNLSNGCKLYIDIRSENIDLSNYSYTLHQEQTYPISLGDLEYCKIGDYEDVFFKNVVGSEYYDSTLELDKWYLKKNIGKVVLDGSESGWLVGSSGTENWFYQVQTDLNNGMTGSELSNYYKYTGGIGGTTTNNGIFVTGNGLVRIRYGAEDMIANYKNWLSTHNVDLYCVSSTPTYTLLNNTLQTQLDNLLKAISYQEQTNVSQTNNDLPFVIKLSAIRDLSGIFELIQ